MGLNINQAVNQAGNSLRQITTKGSQGGKQLGKQDFLNLMMTQMANQDPLDPMDSQAMMQQMAALGSVEQLQNLNTKVDKLTTLQNDIMRSNVFSLLGKDVEMMSKSLNLENGTPASAAYSIDSEADQVFVHITNDKGEQLRTIKEGAQNAGTHLFSWDGKDEDGDLLPDGEYTYTVKAKTHDGEDIRVKQSKRGKIFNVHFEGGRPMVEVNGETLPLDNIKQLSNKTEKLFESAVPLPIKKELTIKQPIITAVPNRNENDSEKSL